MHPAVTQALADDIQREQLARAARARRAREARRRGWPISMGDRRAATQALGPLLLDVAVPVALYYLLGALGVGNTPALIAGGLVPFARSVRSIMRRGADDHLAVLITALVLVSLVLVGLAGSPKLVVARESSGTVLLGLWCLAGAWTRRRTGPLGDVRLQRLLAADVAGHRQESAMR